jgi:hypothetical protein
MLRLIIAVSIAVLSTSAMASKHEKYVDMLIEDGIIKATDKAKTICQMDALEVSVYALDKEIKKAKDPFTIKPVDPYKVMAVCNKQHN